jgi:hypothetical protein
VIHRSRGGWEKDPITPLAALDVKLIQLAVDEIETGWQVALLDMHVKNRHAPEGAIILYWSEVTDFPRPTVYVLAKSQAYMVTVFSFWNHINGVRQEQTFYSDFDSVIAKFRHEARKVKLLVEYRTRDQKRIDPSSATERNMPEARHL